MPQPLKIDPKRDRAWVNRALELSGEKRPRKKRGAPTLGLLGKRIGLLTPEQRVRLEAFVSQLLAEEEEIG